MNTALPVHPNNAYIASLPAFPGLALATWSSHPKDQALKLMAEFKCSEPLPKKGMAVIIQMPMEGFPLIRVTLLPGKSTYGKPLYGFEFFAPAPSPASSVPAPADSYSSDVVSLFLKVRRAAGQHWKTRIVQGWNTGNYADLQLGKFAAELEALKVNGASWLDRFMFPVVKSPSPAEDVACAPDLSGLSPDARNFVLNAEAREAAMKEARISIPATPSPAEPVKVLGGEAKLQEILSLATTRNEDGDKRTPSELACYKIQLLAMDVAKERAAHLAKIQALETAVQRLLEWAYHIPTPASPKLKNDLASDRDAARAALALPSA